MFKKHLWLCILCICPASFAGQGQESPVKVVKIWDQAPHNAFTDLIKFNGRYYCTFREGSGHVPWPEDTDGKIRILVSANGKKWRSAALLEKDDYDLRDSKLSIDPMGRLMVLMGGSNYNNKSRVLINRLTHVSFYDPKSHTFSPPQPVKIDPEVKTGYDWLWRVTWHKGTGFGVVYHKKDSRKSDLSLVKTYNGIDYELITRLPMDGVPGESTVTFDRDDNMIILVRVDSEPRLGRIGTSSYPYTEWKWKETGLRLGGPNIIPFRDDWYLIGTRSFNLKNEAHTSIYLYHQGGEIREIAELPSGGDNSYPGLLINGKELWISYYSSHEGKASVYLAKIPLPFMEKIMVNGWNQVNTEWEEDARSPLKDTPFTNSPEKIRTAPYYDVANFARFVKAKGYYCFGYNDFVCPPTSMYAAYNMITCEKTLNLQIDTGHAVYPDLWKISDQWIMGNLEPHNE